MNRLTYLLSSACLVLTAGAASAQFVKGNEAVRVLPNGTKIVEMPPLPSVSLGTPCPATKGGCAGGGWKMLETSSGLAECTEVFARATTCRSSTFGKDKRSRVWIVKVKGAWLQCERPEITRRCVSLGSLPVSAVQ